jgi:hypothetical protein
VQTGMAAGENFAYTGSNQIGVTGRMQFFGGKELSLDKTLILIQHRMAEAAMR